MSGSYTHVCKDSTKVQRIRDNGISERYANLKYKYENRHFWCRGYYVDTVGKNAKKIEEYIETS